MIKILALTILTILVWAPSQIHACKKKDKIKVLKMERTPCNGICPWYIIEIYEDGKVTYWGRKNAEREGFYEGKIPAKEAQALLKRFQKQKITSAQDEYKSVSADLPNINYEFAIGEDFVMKKVKHANFGPAYFTKLSEDVDVALKDVKWQKSSNAAEE